MGPFWLILSTRLGVPSLLGVFPFYKSHSQKFLSHIRSGGSRAKSMAYFSWLIKNFSYAKAMAYLKKHNTELSKVSKQIKKYISSKKLFGLSHLHNVKPTPTPAPVLSCLVLLSSLLLTFTKEQYNYYGLFGVILKTIRQKY